VMSMSVCLSVSLSARISPEPHTRSLPIFLCIWPMAAARSSSGRVTKSQGKGSFGMMGVHSAGEVLSTTALLFCFKLLLKQSKCFHVSLCDSAL